MDRNSSSVKFGHPMMAGFLSSILFGTFSVFMILWNLLAYRFPGAEMFTSLLLVGWLPITFVIAPFVYMLLTEYHYGHTEGGWSFLGGCAIGFGVALPVGLAVSILLSFFNSTL